MAGPTRNRSSNRLDLLKLFSFICPSYYNRHAKTINNRIIQIKTKSVLPEKKCSENLFISRTLSAQNCSKILVVLCPLDQLPFNPYGLCGLDPTAQPSKGRTKKSFQSYIYQIRHAVMHSNCPWMFVLTLILFDHFVWDDWSNSNQDWKQESSVLFRLRCVPCCARYPLAYLPSNNDAVRHVLKSLKTSPAWRRLRYSDLCTWRSVCWSQPCRSMCVCAR